MGFDVSKGAAYAVLYSVLFFFTVLALGSAGLLSFLPESLNRYVTLSSSKEGVETDHFLSARNSASAWAIALSFFASGMGAWILYGTTEMGATPQLSWLGVLGYSSASSIPALLISWLGPKIRDMSDEQAFSTTDFGLRRYGRVMQVAIAAISVFYMFIYIVAELTSISAIFGILTNESSTAYGIGITVSIGVVTIVYTTIAGLPASIVTDKFQGIMVGTLVVMLTLAVTTKKENHVNREEFAKASNWDIQGFKAAVTLIIAIACAELFNQSTWQRVWAAQDVPSMRKGFFLGSVMVFFLMMFFGIIGMIAYANDPEAYDNWEKFAYLSFFDILEPLGDGWHILVLILVTALAASSIDSLQNGLTSIFYHDLIKFGLSPKWVARGLMVAANIPAVYLASKKWDVIALFLVADIVCATSVMPVFLGLQTQDYSILKAPTEFGAFMGCLAGISTVLVTGVIVDAEGGVFEYFWLRNNGICALCGNETMITFIVTPIVSAFCTYLFTFLDIMVRGEERARKPMFAFAFDEEKEADGSNDLEKATEGGDVDKDVTDGEVVKVDEVGSKESETSA